MRTIAIDAFGAQPTLRELPAPRPKPNEILVRLHAAGVNPYDCKVANGVLDGAARGRSAVALVLARSIS